MIQFKRGTSTQWKRGSAPILAPGQPGFDTTKHKLKIGDGVTKWDALEDVSGLRREEILAEASKADSETLITYGTTAPTNSTKGDIYLQQYDGAVEVDFVVEIGRNVNYFYRKWNSGFIECWGTGTAPDSVKTLFTTLLFDTHTDSHFELKGFYK